MPTERVFFGAAADPDGDHVVTYGGSDAGTTVTPFADTWVYDAKHGWVAKCGTGSLGACAPGPRTGQAMATGPHGVVLFGGFVNQFGDGPTADTWVWNGSTWHQTCTTASCGPSARGFAAMAGDGTHVVLFGGLTGTGLVSDTWVFDGTTWTQTCGAPLATMCGPSGRAAASMAWDGNHFVLFGGSEQFDGSTPPLGDTWVFDGTTWTSACGLGAEPACGPPGRAFGAFSFAPHPNTALSGAVLLGGGNLFSNTTSTLYPDAWWWDGAHWSTLSAPWAGPPVTFDPADGPPAGPDPLLGSAAPRATVCQVLYLGISVARAGATPDLKLTSYNGGRDLDGDGKPDTCALAVVPTTTPPSTVAIPAADELPRTGGDPHTLVLLGAFLIVAGAVTVTARVRRQRAS